MTFYKRYSEGLIEVITGPMFSGKSEELIKRMSQVGYAKIKSLVFKPSLDNRWDEEKVISRSGSTIETLRVKKAKEILEKWDDSYKVVAIDEAQFFDEEIVEVITYLANNGTRVIVSALDQDFDGKPFGFVPNILAVAEFISKESAICMVCGKQATMSFRKGASKEQIEVGNEEYEARCRSCHRQGTILKTSTTCMLKK